MLLAQLSNFGRNGHQSPLWCFFAAVTGELLLLFHFCGALASAVFPPLPCCRSGGVVLASRWPPGSVALFPLMPSSQMVRGSWGGYYVDLRANAVIAKVYVRLEWSEQSSGVVVMAIIVCFRVQICNSLLLFGSVIHLR